MERQPHAQQIEVITVQPGAAGLKNSRFRLCMLIFFMLWPWFWVNIGLFLIRDFRVTIILYELLCCALPIFLFGREHVPLWPLHMRKRWIFLLVLLANIVFLGIFKASGGASLDWTVYDRHIRDVQMGANLEFWGYGVYLVFFNPLFEEMFWRGTVYREWKNFVSPWKANLISSVFFGAWHWIILQYYSTPPWAIASTLVVVLGGIIFAYVYERTGTLGAPILMHGWGADFPLLFIVHTAIIHASTL